MFVILYVYFLSEQKRDIKNRTKTLKTKNFQKPLKFFYKNIKKHVL